MIPKEIEDEFWGRMFAIAKSPFSREEVLEVKDLRSSPFDNDNMTVIALFKLKDGSWGAITGRFAPSWDDILEAESFRCPAQMKEILFMFYEDEKKKTSPQAVLA